jgi:hypothetical protein
LFKDKPFTEDVLEGYKGWRSGDRNDSNYGDIYNFEYLQDSIDYQAWNHLKTQFPGIDILSQNQFVFESKRLCLGFTPHNKVNYILYDVVAGKNKGDAHYVALRGMNRVTNKEGKKVLNPDALKLFEGYEQNQAVKLETKSSKMLSLKDWLKLKESKPTLALKLLPDDQVSDDKNFYSITPLNTRFSYMKEYFAVNKAYQAAKETKDASLVAKVCISNSEQEKAAKRLARLVRD